MSLPGPRDELRDELASLGYEGGSIEQEWANLLRDFFSEPTASPDDLEFRYLKILSGIDKATGDLWKKYLESIGFSGSIPDMANQAVRDGLLGRTIPNLIDSLTSTRSSTRTVWGYPGDGVVADGQSLLTVPANVPAFSGGRYDSATQTWYATDADGVQLSPSLSNEDSGTNLVTWSNDLTQVPWTYDGSRSYVSNGDYTIFQGTSAGPAYAEAFTATDTSHTVAIEAKHVSGTVTDRAFLVRNTTTGTNFDPVVVNLSTGAIISGTGWGVEQTPDGWWRLVYTRTTGITVGDIIRVYVGVTSTTPDTDEWAIRSVNAVAGTSIGSHIKTAGATASRAADNNSIPTPSVLSAESGALKVKFTPSETGQTATILSSYVDANNYTALQTTATTVVLRKRVAGVNYDATFSYTHTAGQLAEADIYWGSAGSGVRAADTATSAEVFGTNADTSDAQLAATLDFNLNGTNSFKDGVSNAGITSYPSKEAAGW